MHNKNLIPGWLKTLNNDATPSKHDYMWQTEKAVANQGGYFGSVDFKGKKHLDHGWTVSHSLDQRLIHHRADFLTLSLGDTFPKGIVFENRTRGRSQVIYPPAERMALPIASP